jgi:hypothetical protein
VLVFQLCFTIVALLVVEHACVILLNKVMLFGHELMVVAC